MKPTRNRMLVPSGMLHPTGLVDTPVNPVVQSTTRPAGTLLQPSPGYDSVRVGKNRFQGRGPTGGFRQMEYAEDVGGSGAALAVTPGETSRVAASEWLPTDEGGFAPEGSVIISDRKLTPGLAARLHGAYGTMVDMGDRHPGRPLSNRWRKFNPASYLGEEYRENPALSVVMGVGLVYAAYLLAGEAERSYRGYRPRGIGTEASGVPAAGAQASGDVAADAINKIGSATDKAVNAIEGATDKAVNAIEGAAESAKSTATGE